MGNDIHYKINLSVVGFNMYLSALDEGRAERTIYLNCSRPLAGSRASEMVREKLGSFQEGYIYILYKF